MYWKAKPDKAGAQYMPGIVLGEGDAFFQGEGLVQLKAPGKVVNGRFEFFCLPVGSAREGQSVVEHGQKQGLCGMGANDFTLKPGFYEIRYPANVVNMSVGEKEVVDLCRWHRELIKGQFRVVTLGFATVY